VYPGPGGVTPSDQYAVQVMQNGRAKQSFVYLAQAQWRSNRSKTTSWTTFSFSGPVTVKVTKLKGSFSKCRILPGSYRIQPEIKSDGVVFKLDCPRKVSVEFDGDITHPLLVFADPLETDVPSRDDANVVYFGPGLHDIEDAYDVRSDTTVYLAGGVYVRGRLRSRDAQNIRVIGRGHMSNYLFEDIRIENADWRLFYITIDQNEFADSSRGMGQISDLVFRNISVDGPMKRANVVRGWDAGHRVRNVRFENVKVNGRYLGSSDEGNFEIDPNTTADIQFVVTTPPAK